MGESPQIEKIAGELTKKWRKVEIRDLEALPFDVSPRRYYRVKYKDEVIPTALVMQLADGFGPLGGGPRKLTQSECFVEMQDYLQGEGIRVPAIYVDTLREGFLLIEDFGTTPLFKHIESLANQEFDPLIDDIDAPDKVIPFGQRALDLLLRLQALEPNPECIAFQRSPTFEQLRAGGEEFIDFILAPLQITEKEQEVFHEAFDNLSEEVLSHPKVFSHYDFMTHNLHLLQDGELGVIDFQDASLESPMRDLHALLCDRDMDTVFGDERLDKLFGYYRERSPYGDRFSELYPEYQVLWDTRVSGRFTKLSTVDGRAKYAQWIEGTSARVEVGFEKLADKFPRFGDGLEVWTKRRSSVVD